MMPELFSSLVQKGDLGESGKGKKVQSSTTEQHQLRTLMGFVTIQITDFSQKNKLKITLFTME